MRPRNFLIMLALPLWLSASAADAAWSFNPSAQRITFDNGTSTLDIQMPYPWSSDSGDGTFGSYDGKVDGYYTYKKSGNLGDRIYRLKYQAIGPWLEITIESDLNANPWSLVRSPRVLTSSTWRKVDVSRYGMPSGHDFHQKASYIDAKDLWIWSFWKPESSHGTEWRQNQFTHNDNSGMGDLTLLPDMSYHANLSGSRQTLKEVVLIQVGDGLWDAVPEFPSDRVSPKAGELKDTVFLDVWSHDSAAELAHYLRLLKRLAGEDTRFFTAWASWASGGNDGLLPDALWLDPPAPFLPYPPNYTGYGNFQSMEALSQLGAATGWLSFRTFYSQLREEGPSAQLGLIRRTLNAAGQETSLTKRGDQIAIYNRQEEDIQDLLGPTGMFTDSVCKGFPFAHKDYDGTVVDGLKMSDLVAKDQEMTVAMKAAHQDGPMLCEGLTNEELIGKWVDGGEYDIHNSFGRLVTPEYKLRRLHGLTAFHGMGQNYRASSISDLWCVNCLEWRSREELDSYRTVQMLFGNGAFILAQQNLEGAIWHHVLSELMIVRPLQKHFVLQPVTAIEYETSGQAPGTWFTLEELVEDQNFVMKTNPGQKVTTGPGGQVIITELDQSTEFERIRVTYANGLKIVVNRGLTDFSVNAGGPTLDLPPDSWVAWGLIGGDSVLAYSAIPPGETERIDFLEDDSQGLRYVDPRDGVSQGVDRPTQWVKKNGAWRVRLEADLEIPWPAVVLEGQRIPLPPSRQKARTSVDFAFNNPNPAKSTHPEQFGGWRTIKGIRSAEVDSQGLDLDIQGKNRFLHSPRLELAGDSTDIFDVDVRFNSPTSGNTNFTLLFTREGDRGFVGDRSVTVAASVMPGWQTVSIPIGTATFWHGATITQLRLDVARGAQLPAPIDMTIGAVRMRSAP